MCVPRNIHREMKKVRCTRTNMHVDSNMIYIYHTRKKLVYLYMYMRMYVYIYPLGSGLRAECGS